MANTTIKLGDRFHDLRNKRIWQVTNTGPNWSTVRLHRVNPITGKLTSPTMIEATIVADHIYFKNWVRVETTTDADLDRPLDLESLTRILVDKKV